VQWSSLDRAEKLENLRSTSTLYKREPTGSKSTTGGSARECRSTAELASPLTAELRA